MTERTDDEKLALHLHRYKGWVNTQTTRLAEIKQLQEQTALLAEHAINAYLEAREEREELMRGGMTKEQVDAVAPLPPLPLDPLTLLKNARLQAMVTKEGAKSFEIKRS